MRPLRPPNEAAIERYWRIDRQNCRGFIKAAFNVAPTTQVPILVQAHDGAIELIGALGVDPGLVERRQGASYDIQRALRRGGGQADVAAEHALHVLSDACTGGDGFCEAVVHLGAASIGNPCRREYSEFPEKLNLFLKKMDAGNLAIS